MPDYVAQLGIKAIVKSANNKTTTLGTGVFDAIGQASAHIQQQFLSSVEAFTF